MKTVINRSGQNEDVTGVLHPNNLNSFSSFLNLLHLGLLKSLILPFYALLKQNEPLPYNKTNSRYPMKTFDSETYKKPALEQVSVKSTSWIGHYLNETKNRVVGQTFFSPEEGELETIQIYSDLVAESGPVEMSIHSFDPQTKTWGPAIGIACVNLKENDSGKWIAFPLKGFHYHLQKGKSYGFRLKNNTGLVGLGETPVSFDKKQPANGEEWNTSSGDNLGKYFSYLSLAFKVEMRA